HPGAFSRLPGPEGQEPLSPRPRRRWGDRGAAESARPAAALALLYPDGGDTAILLTVRGSHLLSHGGQISLPGGAIEPGEAGEGRALRESAEEIGLDPAAVTLRGRLTPLSIPVSGYVLHTVVATASPRPSMTPREVEVSRLIEPRIEALASSLAKETRDRGGVAVEVPYFALGAERRWGATARVVAELLTLLGRSPGQRAPWHRRQSNPVGWDFAWG